MTRKSRLIAALLLPLAVSVAARAATLDIANGDNVPHSVVIDRNDNSIRVLAGPGGSMIPPGQDIAMRVEHGMWRIYGDTGREMRVRFHHDNDYRLQLRPYVYGDDKVLVGELDDGYSHWNEALADLGRLPRVGEPPPPPQVDPRHHRHHDRDPQYPDWNRRNDADALAGEAGHALGAAIADAFDSMLFHHDGREPDRRPPPPPPPPPPGHHHRGRGR